MNNIDITLDGQHEVTPEFSIFDIVGAREQVESEKIVAHAVRTTNTNTAVNIALEMRVRMDDGSVLQEHNGTGLVDSWVELSGSWIEMAATDHGDIGKQHTNDNLQHAVPGAVYRLRYASSATVPIRIVVYTPFRRV